MGGSQDRRMVFEDRTGRRWRRVSLLLAFSVFVAYALAANTYVGSLTAPSLPALPAAAAAAVDSHFFFHSLNEEPPDPSPEQAPVASTGPLDRKSARPRFAALGAIRSAFVVQDDSDSVLSLRKHLSSLQVVFPGWIRFDTMDGQMSVSVDSELRQMLHASSVLVMPRVSNTALHGDYLGTRLSALFGDAAATQVFIRNLIEALRGVEADGVNIDIEEVLPADKAGYVDWLRTVTDALHQQDFVVTVDVPASNQAFDYAAIGAIADASVLMSYDEHWTTGAPGPIASQDWFDDNLNEALKSIPAQKLIVALGAYGYNWTEGAAAAEAVNFEAAAVLASRFGGEIALDPESLNSHLSYTDDKGKHHQVWLLDAISAWNELVSARNHHVRGLSLWRTGSEDPSLWTFFAKGLNGKFDPHALAEIPALGLATYRGQGQIVRVRSAASKGNRTIEFDGDTIAGAKTSVLPRGFDVDRFGAGVGKQIALTFDDGPDPQWTPQVLDVLDTHKVPATFFVVGRQAERFPGLLSRMYKSGHLVGNHTYSHPDLSRTSSEKLVDELNTAQRAIEAATGRSTELFRPPYSTDAEPSARSQLRPLVAVDQLGYVVSAADVDAKDYVPGRRASAIKDSVMAQVADGKPHVVVFHDAGGNRRNTSLALDELIPALQAEGYQIVGLDQLMGLSRETVMPELKAPEGVLVTMQWVIGRTQFWAWRLMIWSFGASLTIATLRLIFLGVVVITRRELMKTGNSVPRRAATVRALIPAHNEAKVIARTLKALLASDYPYLTVTVIDDGSKDETSDIVRQIAAADPRVSLITQTNTGKSGALNRAFRESPEDIIVTIDADTIVLPQTVRKLVERLADPRIDAVCGNVKVGNVENMLTAFQNIEYITAQGFDRRAFEALNCIWVVPGATGAWRRKRVLEIGGYSDRTLTEDTDLTQELLARGGRVAVASDAISITEAPDTALALYKQRFRWNYGTLQCLWKHRANWFKGSIGWVAMPNMLLFQFLLPLLAPVGDIVFIISLLQLNFGPIVLGYLVFLLMDMSGSIIAFRYDQQPLKGLWLILLQRFYYRQFMYYVTFMALRASLRGHRHGWNKLNRTGAAQGAQAPLAAAA